MARCARAAIYSGTGICCQRLDETSISADKAYTQQTLNTKDNWPRMSTDLHHRAGQYRSAHRGSHVARLGKEKFAPKGWEPLLATLLKLVARPRR
jgi:hypothetical protein